LFGVTLVSITPEKLGQLGATHWLWRAAHEACQQRENLPATGQEGARVSGKLK